MKKFKTNEDRLSNLKKRGQLIKESFQKEFNKIKRIDEEEGLQQITIPDKTEAGRTEFNHHTQIKYTDGTEKNIPKKNKSVDEGELNEGNEKDYTEQVTLSNGVEYKVYIHPFKQWTSDSIDRYSIYVKNRVVLKTKIKRPLIKARHSNVW